MARKAIDMVGQKVGRLTVLARDGARGNRAAWACACDCGNRVTVAGGELRKGDTKSCGCLNSEMASERKRKHGMAGSPEHITWCRMRQRCNDPNDKRWRRYGGRGITICDAWKDFGRFLKDMGKRPKGLSLERIDNDGPYSPDNCQWATPRQQANNRKTSAFVEHDGERLTLAQWSRRTGIHHNTLRYRMRAGWPAERMFQR